MSDPMMDSRQKTAEKKKAKGRGGGFRKSGTELLIKYVKGGN